MVHAIVGCLDVDACNFDNDANTQLGDIEVCEYCDSPEEFEFSQSSIQNFYYFENAYDINGEPLVAGEDWVASYNGDICVGAREWSDDSYTDIPVMGDDGFFYSEGYMTTGDYPTFKIYDASLDMIFDASPSQQYPFEEGPIIYTVDQLTIIQTYEFENHTNLISFVDIPEDNSIGGIFEPIYDNVSHIIGEGVSTMPDDDGGWVGSLNNVECTKGYWLTIHEANDSLSMVGSGECSIDQEYSLHGSANLISYPLYQNQTIGGSLPDYVEEGLLGIIAAGEAAILVDGSWVGSLVGFTPKHGYWLIASYDMQFSYEIEDQTLARQPAINHNLYRDLPPEFSVLQSTIQAFMFVKDINSSELSLDENDMILAYCNNQLVGSRYWSGKYTDIAIMGMDDSEYSRGYCELGDKVDLKYYDSYSGEIIDIASSEGTVIYEPNTIQVLSYMDVLPTKTSISTVYPNPFNPTTTISFSVPTDIQVDIKVYNIQGGEIANLVNNYFSAGNHSVIWNADTHSSGVYFVKMVAGNFVNTQKLMLIK